jgi:hypothetical protein
MAAKKKKGGGTRAGAGKGAGTEACASCGASRELFWHGRRKICEACIEERAHPAELGPVTMSSVVAGARAIARDAGGPMVLLALGFALPGLLFELYAGGSREVSIGWSFLIGFIQVIGMGAVFDLGLRVLDREPPDYGAAVRTGLTKSLPLFLAIQIQQLIVVVHLVFLVAPAFMKAASYAVLVPLVVGDEAGPIQALSESTKRMHGHRKAVFPLLLAVWLPTIAMLFFELAFNLERKPIFADDPGADWALRVGITILFPLLDLLWVLVALSLHAKLRHGLRLPAASRGR